MPQDGGNNDGGGGGGRPSRLQELLASMPPVTLGFTGLCVVIYLYTLFVDVNLGDVSISTYFIVYQRELYRVLTSAVFHAGIMHIGMNMLSFQAMGIALERLFGSLMFFLLIMITIMVSAVLYIGACFTLAWTLRDLSWMFYNSVGFSGVLFALAALESTLSPAPTRSVFGLITVPTKLYPWALLLVLQVLMPGISLVGHLAGLVVGLLYARGWLRWAFPSNDTVQQLEDQSWFACIRRLNGYIPCPMVDVVQAASDRAGGDNVVVMAFRSILAFLAPAWYCVRPVAAPVVSAVTGAWTALCRVVRREPAAAAATRRGNWGGGTLNPDDDIELAPLTADVSDHAADSSDDDMYA